MKWFNFELSEKIYNDCEPEGMLVYLSPEALKHAIVVNDLEVFQNSPECVSGGRMLEVSRQFTYHLRQVADLVEEPLDPRHGEERGHNSGETFSAEQYPPQKTGPIPATTDVYEHRQTDSHAPSWMASHKA